MSKVHWLALSTIPGIGGATARKLLERFGDVESIFNASIEDLSAIPRISVAMAEQTLAVSLESLEAELLLLNDEGIDLLTWDDERFPAHLQVLSDAPMLLFVRGALRSEDAHAVAIVGTREPTPFAAEIASTLARELASRDLTIISGLALGIDSAAHRGALETGRTLAVLGSGIRFIHPKENIELAEEIAGNGALLSELHPNTPPRGPQLMARDRIVSGLSRAVIVVEAGAKSGSLDTAAKAIKQGRLLLALPGSPGTDQLIASGAHPLDPNAIDFDALADAIKQHPLPNDPNTSPSQTTMF